MTFEYLGNAAIVDIRKYLISEIHKTDILNGVTYPAKFGGKIPVVPIQQLPETNNTLKTKPFIVYDLAPMPNNRQEYWIKCEELTLYVYGSDYSQVLAIQDFLVDVFGRLDKSAQDLNEIDSRKVSFLTCFLSGDNKVMPAQSEGGKYGATVSIEYDYTREIDGNGRFAS